MKKAFVLLFVLSGCASRPSSDSSSTHARNISSESSRIDINYENQFPPVDLGTYPHYPMKEALGEALQPGEKEDVEKSVQAVERMIMKRLRELKQKGRGDHSTSHGCYPAKVQILETFPSQDLERGVASRASHGAIHEAIVRLSNAETPDSPDLRAASMGLALKIYLESGSGPRGLKDDDFLLGSENPGLREQDFLAGIHSTFLAKDIHDYSEIFDKRVDPTLMDYAKIGLKHPKAMLVDRLIKPMSRGVDDAPLFLQKQFFSILPYSWGDRAAKFMFVPCHPEATEKPGQKAKELRYQEDLIKNFVASNEICYRMLVQLRPERIDPALGNINPTLIDRYFPVEDASAFWPISAPNNKAFKHRGKRHEIYSTPKDVARITIARATEALPPEQCEKTVFNPWNGLKEHQPLGSLGRARLSVYKKSKDVRYRIYKSE